MLRASVVVQNFNTFLMGVPAAHRLLQKTVGNLEKME